MARAIFLRGRRWWKLLFRVFQRRSTTSTPLLWEPSNLLEVFTRSLSSPHPLVFGAVSSGSDFHLFSLSGAERRRKPKCHCHLRAECEHSAQRDGCGKLHRQRHLDVHRIAARRFVHFQSRHPQPCRRHGPIVDADCFHDSRQHGRHGQTLSGARHDNVELRDLCRQSAATLAETPSRLLDVPRAHWLRFAAVGLWWQWIIDPEVE